MHGLHVEVTEHHVAPPFQPLSLKQSLSLSLPGAACARLAGPRAMCTMISGFLCGFGTS